MYLWRNVPILCSILYKFHRQNLIHINFIRFYISGPSILSTPTHTLYTSTPTLQFTKILLNTIHFIYVCVYILLYKDLFYIYMPSERYLYVSRKRSLYLSALSKFDIQHLTTFSAHHLSLFERKKIILIPYARYIDI